MYGSLPVKTFLSYTASMQHHSFYELIALKAKGKTGPLFTWDVHDDVRLYADATREKDEVRVLLLRRQPQH